MKKIIITALTLFLAVMPASDIYGNGSIWDNGNDEGNSYESVFEETTVFGGRKWLSEYPEGDNYAPMDDMSGTPDDPGLGVPAGEGLLILMAGGLAYAASKIRRKK